MWRWVEKLLGAREPKLLPFDPECVDDASDYEPFVEAVLRHAGLTLESATCTERGETRTLDVRLVGGGQASGTLRGRTDYVDFAVFDLLNAAVGGPRRFVCGGFPGNDGQDGLIAFVDDAELARLCGRGFEVEAGAPPELVRRLRNDAARPGYTMIVDGRLRRDTVIDGVPIAAGRVAQHPDGAPQRYTLARAHAIAGLVLPSGARIETFDERHDDTGRYEPYTVELPEPAEVGGAHLPAGATIHFEDRPLHVVVEGPTEIAGHRFEGSTLIPWDGDRWVWDEAESLD